MKIAGLFAASLLSLAGAIAEDVVITTEKSALEAAAERQKKIQADRERAKALLEKKPVTYGGFVHDLKQAENKRKFLSLRQPRDSQNDSKNISYDERNGRPRGFVLFRLDF